MNITITMKIKLFAISLFDLSANVNESRTEIFFIINKCRMF